MKGGADFEEFKSERWYDTESPHKASSSLISESEFSCHCCYHILLNPTTLNCGHSFCRHCLALWDAVEKLFPEVVVERRGGGDSSPRIVQSLCAFQRYGDDQASQGLNPLSGHRPRGSGFFSGVLTALTCVAVVLLVYHWSSREVQQDLLLHKPVTKWTAEDVILWLEQLGPWASLYKERFLEEQAVNAGKSLFLVYALKSSPRLTLLYLYLFDYTETFLPFMHTSCPGSADAAEEPDILTKHLLNDPSWKQWVEFLVKYSLLPYQLMAEFAWDWLAVHYWTSRFIIVNAMLLSVLEGFTLWRLWSRRELSRALPHRMWSHFWKVSTQGLLVAIVWPMIPQFICNCLFYWALYFNPIINIDLVVKEVRRLETHGP
ncbi:UNVERIFIED_CONTAM: hypothetical protein FKN15_046551 [Acipenser sinensis]